MPVSDNKVSPGAERLRAKTFFASSVALAAGGVETVIAPASNTNGVWIDKAEIAGYGAAGVRCALIAATSAPGSINAAGAVLRGVQGVANVWANSQLQQGVYIQAGLGLYFYSDAAETAGSRTVGYSLL